MRDAATRPLSMAQVPAMVVTASGPAPAAYVVESDAVDALPRLAIVRAS